MGVPVGVDETLGPPPDAEAGKPLVLDGDTVPGSRERFLRLSESWLETEEASAISASTPAMSEVDTGGVAAGA